MVPYDIFSLRGLFINRTQITPDLVWLNAMFEICNSLTDHETIEGPDGLHGREDVLIRSLVVYAVHEDAVWNVTRFSHDEEDPERERIFALLCSLPEGANDSAALLNKAIADPHAFMIAACARLEGKDGAAATLLYRNKNLTSQEARGYVKHQASEFLAKVRSVGNHN